MRSSRVKDPGLGAQIEEDELAWLRYVTPVTEHYCHRALFDVYPHEVDQRVNLDAEAPRPA